MNLKNKYTKINTKFFLIMLLLSVNYFFFFLIVVINILTPPSPHYILARQKPQMQENQQFLPEAKTRQQFQTSSPNTV